jgi:tetratricopeptide (TPR) repeat protein
VAFVQGDTATMQQQLDWAMSRPNNYDAYDWQAATAAFSGQLKKAREYSSRAVELAGQRGVKDVAAGFASLSILRDAILGNCQQVRESSAGDLIPGQDWLSLQRRAHTLALCGQLDQASSLTDELARRNPKDTVVNEIWVPVTRAEIEIRRGNAARVIQLLQGVTRFEGAAFFWPAYLRGEAYLRLRDGAKAAAEFQSILDHRGYSPVSLLYPLAHLGAGRAAALSGEMDKSRKAYQDFLALWKEADPDIPLLQQARQEYEKIK